MNAGQVYLEMLGGLDQSPFHSGLLLYLVLVGSLIPLLCWGRKWGENFRGGTYRTQRRKNVGARFPPKFKILRIHQNTTIKAKSGRGDGKIVVHCFEQTTATTGCDLYSIVNQFNSFADSQYPRNSLH